MSFRSISTEFGNGFAREDGEIESINNFTILSNSLKEQAEMIKEQAQHIACLSQRLHGNSSNLIRLNNELNHKDRQIEALSSQVRDFSNLMLDNKFQFSVIIDQKDNEISSLKALIEEKEHLIGQLLNSQETIPLSSAKKRRRENSSV